MSAKNDLENMCGRGQFFGTAPKPTFSDVHKAIFGFNSDSKATPEGIASAPAPKH